MSVAEDLRAARALIDTPEKWCKHAGQDGERRCAQRALVDGIACDEGEGDYFAHFAASRDALKTQIGGRRIYMWNDDFERTHADVMAAMDATIASAE